MNVHVDLLRAPSPASGPLEIVERKGVGHPDTICDAIAESVSAGLSRHYVERFGAVLHHNVDKALLCGGAARPAFGGGEVLAPVEIHLAGRATWEFDGIKVPVDDLAIDSSRAWLRAHVPVLADPAYCRIIPHIRPTSVDLFQLFRRSASQRGPLANDTSFGVGFAPLDTLESTVLAVERSLATAGSGRVGPAIGADTKVMGARRGRSVDLTVACALIGRHLSRFEDYLDARERLQSLAVDTARQTMDGPLTVCVNAADGDTPDSVYLTVTGLSAESGDDGQVGRGNRVNGLITPYRPMSLEAAAGKNPVTHVGKLYSLMAHRTAGAIRSQVPGVDEVYCYLLSQIGRPIAEPAVFDVRVRIAGRHLAAPLARQIVEVSRESFAQVSSVWREAIAGTLCLW
ncbi:MAG: methionine adenosyltransferase [Thermomicrobiales bacterium]|nr:methionine adenosyltransferase [Thermomicrobiales bacterium]